jgi:hypothetical protein
MLARSPGKSKLSLEYVKKMVELIKRRTVAPQRPPKIVVTSRPAWLCNNHIWDKFKGEDYTLLEDVHRKTDPYEFFFDEAGGFPDRILENPKTGETTLFELKTGFKPGKLTYKTKQGKREVQYPSKETHDPNYRFQPKPRTTKQKKSREKAKKAKLSRKINRRK